MKYIATISGGKDSVTMCDLLLKNGYKVDYIIFNDTTNEFKEMYDYIKKVKIYFKKKYNKEIITTTPIRNFKDSVLRKVTRSKTEHRNGQSVGIPTASDVGICHLRKTFKIGAFDKWVNANIKEEYKVYIGYTLGEANRKMKDDKFLYPLIDNFYMTEENCRDYLISEDMENQLYKHFTRTGCGLCPFKSERDWFNTWKYYPDIFNLGKEIEKELSLQKEYKFFHKMKSLEEHEKKFKRHDISLFDFSNEPLKDCFCKI